MAALHWKDLIYFERLPNGDVRVSKHMVVGGPALFEMTVPAREWCSIVSGCSATPSDKTFYAIEKIHTGR